MNATLWCLLLFLSVVVIIGCATTELDRPYRAISPSGKIVLPVLGSEETLWVDDGPMIVTGRNPDISYRVIDKAEIAFAGSKKTPFDFFRAVLDRPTEIPELSLAKSLCNHKAVFNLNVDRVTMLNDGKALSVGQSPIKWSFQHLS